jgi:LPXTG-motif cell wall-anchored protein
MPIGPSNIVALPSVIARGGQLTITVDGCPQGGTATSTAFRPTILNPVGGSTAKGTATIDRKARPGAHSITVHCVNAGRPLTHPNAFTVIGGVRGGLGGSTSTGATPTDMAIGGGLIAVALVGGGLFWMRRRSEKRI